MLKIPTLNVPPIILCEVQRRMPLYLPWTHSPRLNSIRRRSVDATGWPSTSLGSNLAPSTARTASRSNTRAGCDPVTWAFWTSPFAATVNSTSTHPLCRLRAAAGGYFGLGGDTTRTSRLSPFGATGVGG